MKAIISGDMNYNLGFLQNVINALERDYLTIILAENMPEV
jgi:hypothetical protein